MKNRILHVFYGLGLGGAENLVVHYIKALGFEKYHHYVFYFGPDGPIKDRFESLGVKVYSGHKIRSIKQPIRFIISLKSLFQDLIAFIKNHKIDVIQSHLNHANQLAVVVGKLTGVPAFPTIHSTMPFIDRRNKLDIRIYIKKAVNQIIYRIADKVIAVSQEVKEIICNHFKIDKSKVVVVKNGIILNNESKNYFDNANKKFDLNNKLHILAVGRLSYEKNFEAIIKAVPYLLNKGFKNIYVKIVGMGMEYDRLAGMIKSLDLTSHVELLGIRNDVLELMMASDLFVMPSRYEGLSIAMIEAFACGLPVVASDVPGLNNYINHNKNGLLFPVDNYEIMAEYILRLANDITLRKKLSKNAKNTFIKEFDLNRNIKTLDTTFQKYIAKEQFNFNLGC